jgi:hypothetical protein
MSGPPTRNSAATNDDVPLRMPYFHPAPASNARREVRYGTGGQGKETYQQQLINSLRGMQPGAGSGQPLRKFVTST